jgi:hypothetical protein
MKRKSAGIAVAVGVTGILAACGHDHSSEMPPPMSTPTPPPTSTAVNVTTSELLANYATQPSEVRSPVTVNNGMFTITDTSETTTPINVNGS